METVKVKLAELVLDYDAYPRVQTDAHTVTMMLESFKAGIKFPPIVICKKTKRVSDGFHRAKMYYRALEPTGVIECEPRNYKTEAEFLLDATVMNNHHGRALTQFDRVHCILRAEALGIKSAQIAAALGITSEAVGKLTANRVGTLKLAKRNGQGTRVPIKRTIQHMSGKRLTKAQHEANAKLGGMQQLFYVNQLITLIENELVDIENKALMDGLKRLDGLLSPLLAKA